jgi:hypothetical protein
MSEIDIQRDILMNISMFNLKAFRMNNAAVYDANRGCYRKPGPFAPKGLADIMVFSAKGVCFLEVKDKGKQSAEQVEFQQTCERYGIHYGVVTSTAEAREFLQFWGIIGGDLI